MNLHYQFWVDYYDLFEDESVMSMPEGNEKDEKIKKTIQRKNHELVNSKWKLSQEEIPLFGDMQTLTFKVLYPGLLMGLGYEHSTDLVKDAPKIALGMSLDYTTGLPYIPGSEVKGLFRSAFIGSKVLIRGYLAEAKEEFSQLTDQEIHALEVDIFGHTHPCDPDYNPSKEAGEGQGKDVFFDAFPISPDSNGHLIGLENITSHISYDPELKDPCMYQGLTDPNPITLLKVMPGVVFLFRFKLCDSEITVNNKTVSITAEQKLKLFENIITDFGMGAKTNVGFGLLEKTDESINRNYLSSVSIQSVRPVQTHEIRPSSDRPERRTSSQSETKRFDTVITEIRGNRVYFKDTYGKDRFTFKDNLAAGVKWEDLAEHTKCKMELIFVEGKEGQKKPKYTILEIVSKG